MIRESECNIHKHQERATILYTNIHSLRYKIPHIEWEIKQMPNVLAFCITETFLGPEVNSGEIKIQGFDLFRRDRSGKGGGVAVYLRSKIKAEQIALASPSEAILLKCRVQKITFYLSNHEPVGFGSLGRKANFA